MINAAIVRTDKLGDMVLTLPMCKAIKEFDSRIKVTVIAGKYVEPLLYQCPYIDNVEFEPNLNQLFKEKKFDVVFYPRPRFEEVLPSFINRIPDRVGSAYRWYSFFLNNKVKDHRKTGNYHEAEYNVRLVNQFFQKKLKTELVRPVLNPEYIETTNQKLTANEISKDEKFIIIHPGSGGSAFEYPAEKFAEVAEYLSSNTNYKILVTGIPSEDTKCKTVSSQNKNILNVCGMFNLWEMIVLISRSSLFLSNSTGVLHVAAALGIPAIGLYPNTSHLSPRRWAPYSENSITLTPPDNSDDMNMISTSTIIDNCLLSIDSH